MHIYNKILPCLLIPLMLMLSGCPSSEKSSKVVTAPEPVEGLHNQAVAKRFEEATPAEKNPTAVESAIDLSQKYARVSEEAAILRQKSQNLAVENQQLKEQVTSLDSQLQQAKKELTEANNLLVEMRIELNNWKADVIGFRDEMRDASKAQLEALMKILRTLGGEVKTESSPEKSNQAQPQKPKTTGEPNA